MAFIKCSGGGNKDIFAYFLGNGSNGTYTLTMTPIITKNCSASNNSITLPPNNYIAMFVCNRDAYGGNSSNLWTGTIDSQVVTFKTGAAKNYNTVNIHFSCSAETTYPFTLSYVGGRDTAGSVFIYSQF